MPSLLVIRDTAGHVFGSFTSEGWRVATRFYGTGETFVFQLQARRFSMCQHNKTCGVTCEPQCCVSA